MGGIADYSGSLVLQVPQIECPKIDVVTLEKFCDLSSALFSVVLQSVFAESVFFLFLTDAN